jgi:hypothetical protein
VRSEDFADLVMSITTSINMALGDPASPPIGRFNYCAKPTRAEKERGLAEAGFVPQQVNDGRETSIDNAYQRGDTERLNAHPTVKGIRLMRYLVNLVTPPGGTVLDPFAGSGTTGVAAIQCGFSFIGVERDPSYVTLAWARLGVALADLKEEDLAPSQPEAETVVHPCAADGGVEGRDPEESSGPEENQLEAAAA